MLDTPRTVREVTDRIRDLFDSDSALSDIWISGEVLESTVSRSGHVFFTLAGDGAQIRCVLFRMNALRQRALPSPGAACAAHGKVEVYPTEGTYQFYVDLVEEAGIGLAALELELLRQQLEAEGLFDPTRKRPIPDNARIVGIVTSSSGAVWHDIQHVVRRRFPFAQLLLAPAAVQGEAASSELVAALQSLVIDGRAEVIVIARGGGSAADLAAFNDENLLRAVFATPVPVVSAIGHETDWSLLDLVADLRAPTPSAAAELVTRPVLGDLHAIVERLAVHLDRVERDVATQIVDLDRRTNRLEHLGPAATIPIANERRAHLAGELEERMSTLLTSKRERLATTSSANGDRVRLALDRCDAQLGHADDLLQALSPAKTLGRGYAFVEEQESGRPVRSAAQVHSGSVLRTRFHDGAIESIVSTASS
ncbi:MAG: exodeoxyribonuclease VII large subunit [Thermomicrobiales bacterium]|nr:exodeoxyribonuclease VII large subunit [Thermomicrobiales bacterium]